MKMKIMAKKVLILSSSPRRGGNSDRLCDRFMAGAQQAGHEPGRTAILPPERR